MLVIVTSFANPLEAHIALGRLRAEEIEAYLLHEHHVWANWMYSQALGGVKIQVAERDLDRAREILASYEQGDFEQPPLDLDEKSIVCPLCSSNRYRR